MSKKRVPLGLRRSVPKPEEPNKIENKPVAKEEKKSTPTIVEKVEQKPAIIKEKKSAPIKEVPKAKGRPSTKKGKKLVKYSMDIHPELKRAVVKAAAIYDKDVHVMWNEIIFDWFSKETKKHPEWYQSIKVKKSEL